jgi:hypothetical protein
MQFVIRSGQYYRYKEADYFPTRATKFCSHISRVQLSFMLGVGVFSAARFAVFDINVCSKVRLCFISKDNSFYDVFTLLGCSVLVICNTEFVVPYQVS